MRFWMRVFWIISFLNVCAPAAFHRPCRWKSREFVIFDDRRVGKPAGARIFKNELIQNARIQKKNTIIQTH